MIDTLPGLNHAMAYPLSISGEVRSADHNAADCYPEQLKDWCTTAMRLVFVTAHYQAKHWPVKTTSNVFVTSKVDSNRALLCQQDRNSQVETTYWKIC